MLPGWAVAADSTTSSSILIQWTNLTSLLNRQVLHYFILINRTNGNALAHAVTEGNILNTKIRGLENSTNYRLEAFGVDGQHRLYKTLEVQATTKNGTHIKFCPISIGNSTVARGICKKYRFAARDIKRILNYHKPVSIPDIL